MCAEYHDFAVRDVQARSIQCDEIWSFCYAKRKNVPRARQAPEDAGNVLTWTALDADSKLIISYLVGGRDSDCALEFLADVRWRLANRVQMTTGGYKAYLEAVDDAFGDEIDYAQLVKIYGSPPEKDQKRYSSDECIGICKVHIFGSPVDADISTSYVERQNLTMSMSMRRFTRLTNAFSKKIENHIHALSLYFVYYNFCRVHKSLRVSPAMETGLTDTLYDMDFIITLLESQEDAVSRKRGPYRKRK